MFEGTSLTWTDAELACTKDGGHLVSVSDQKVKAVVSYIASEVNQPFFIGLKYDVSLFKMPLIFLISWSPFGSLVSSIRTTNCRIID